MRKKFSCLVYIASICCVIYCISMMIIGGNTVKYPDAMIPFTEIERYGVFLGVGCIPMLIAWFLFIKTWKIKTIKRQLVSLIPWIPTAIMFMYGVMIIFSMIIFAIKDIILDFYK